MLRMAQADFWVFLARRDTLLPGVGFFIRSIVKDLATFSLALSGETNAAAAGGSDY